MVESICEIITKFIKVDKFKGNDFRRLKKKNMHFMFTTLKVVYLLTTPRHEEFENKTLEETKKINKWEYDDYICRGYILNGMFDSSLDTQNDSKNANELWDTLESKYIVKDASSKKFLNRYINNYKMLDYKVYHGTIQ